MKKTSKLFALLLSLLMIFSLFTACGEDKSKDDDDKEDKKTSAVADEKEDKDEEAKDEKEDKDEEAKDEKEDTTEADEKADAAVSTEKLLIGEWETSVEAEGMTVNLSIIFDEDGTAYYSFSEKQYNAIFDQALKDQMDEITDEDIAGMGLSSRKEAEEYLRGLMEAELPYDAFVEQVVPEDVFTWELEGDTLTITSESGQTSTSETKLSEGKTTITIVDDTADGETMEFTKIK